MKKTISIHIKGINFLIEEGAYEVLKSYMARLEEKLEHTVGKEHIIEDIELRIAELFSSWLSDRKKVIQKIDVYEVIQTLGEPEQFFDEDDISNGSEKKKYDEEDSFETSDRKLYRDIENAKIAGVCAGLANYFQIDQTVVRIFLVLFTIAAGFGVPLYIVLWIALPAANSHIDRLRMQGRPITVKSVQEEVEMAAQRMAESSEKLVSKMQRESVFQRGLSSVGKIIAKIFGAFFLFFGVIMSITFLILMIGQVGIIPIKSDDGFISFQHFSNLLFGDSEQMNFLWLTISILSITGIIWLIATGTKLLFQLKFPWYGYFSRIVLFIGIGGVITAFYFGSLITREFSIEKSIENEIISSTDVVDLKIENQRYSRVSRRYNDRNYWLKIKNHRILDNDVDIRYEVSPDSLFHILEVKSAMGRNDHDALKRAKNIQFRIEKKDSLYFIPDAFNYPEKDKIRNQRVKIYVQIPEGKSLKENDELIYLDN